MNEQKIDFREGSIEFWIKKGQVRYNNGQAVTLLDFSTKEGSISVVKDSDNILKVSHVLIGKGKTNLEYDVSSLSSEKAHYVVVTWSIKSKEVNLYIDAEPVAKTKIEY